MAASPPDKAENGSLVTSATEAWLVARRDVATGRQDAGRCLVMFGLERRAVLHVAFLLKCDNARVGPSTAYVSYSRGHLDAKLTFIGEILPT